MHLNMNDRIKHYADKLACEIDSWDLKLALENGEPVIVIDARSREAHEAEHIPGAVSRPHDDQMGRARRFLAEPMLETGNPVWHSPS